MTYRSSWRPVANLIFYPEYTWKPPILSNVDCWMLSLSLLIKDRNWHTRLVFVCHYGWCHAARPEIWASLGIASVAFSDRAPRDVGGGSHNRSRPFFWRHTIVSQRLLTAYNTRCVSLHLCFSGVYRNRTLAVLTVYRNCTAYVPKLHRQNWHVPNATSFVPKLTCTEIVHPLSRKCHVPIWTLPSTVNAITRCLSVCPVVCIVIFKFF